MYFLACCDRSFRSVEMMILGARLPELPVQLDRHTAPNVPLVSCSALKGFHFDPRLAIYTWILIEIQASASSPIACYCC